MGKHFDSSYKVKEARIRKYLPSQYLKLLQNILTKVGAVVHIMEKENNISCVLMAQTARMLAYNLPMVREGSAKNLEIHSQE